MGKGAGALRGGSSARAPRTARRARAAHPAIEGAQARRSGRPAPGAPASATRPAAVARRTAGDSALTIWTVGHSTLAIEEFLERLAGHGIEHVADVRSVPRSRRHPHFAGEALSAELARRRVGYSHHRDLGGFRKPRPDSPNRGWRNENFRGYADHMGTPAFQAALDELVARSRGVRVAILCAEADPWHCHRRLISDALLARRVTVLHIRDAARAEPHHLAPPARLDGERVTYPATDLFEGDPTPP